MIWREQRMMHGQKQGWTTTPTPVLSLPLGGTSTSSLQMSSLLSYLNIGQLSRLPFITVGVFTPNELVPPELV
jgi:hypothetical protein